jgi:hypothetical protein
MALAQSAVSAGVNAVVGFLRTLPGRAAGALAGVGAAIRGALAGAGGWLVDAGRQIIMGLVNGIRNAVGAAVSAVKNAVGSVVSGAKRALGIGSPSKVFATIGADTVAGYIAGIEKNIGDANAAITPMTLPPAVAKAAVGGPTRPAGFGGGFDEARIAAAVAKALHGMEWRFVDVDRVVSRSLGYRADLARRGG